MNIETRQHPASVADQLDHVLRGGGIPAPYDRLGARLLARLERPVRIAVTGLPGSGKSTLVAMLSGQDVIGADLAAPVIELTHGAQDRVQVERQDGSVLTLAGLVKAGDCPADAVRVRQEMPARALNGKSYVEERLAGGLADMHETLEAVATRADIVIWCSQGFSEIEQGLWAAMPDRIKDHAILALTKADLLARAGTLGPTIDRLAPVSAEEFLGLYPVATLQGIAARRMQDDPDETSWTASGGAQLLASLRKQIRQGRSADIDRAQVFLGKLGALLPAEGGVPARAEDGDNAVAAAPVDAIPAGIVAQAVAPADPRTVTLLSEAIDMLQEHGQKMLAQVDRAAEFDPDTVLNACTEAMSSLSRLLERGKADDPLGRDARESVEEGEEILMLFQLEQSQEAALDAVTLLLQIRKELIGKVPE